MKGLFATAFLTVLVLPVAASAYDPVPDQALVRVLGERIDGDVNQGLLPNDRAALMRAEIEAAQKLVTNGDSQATAMLADIDRDLAPYDNTVDINEASRDLMYHVADTITIAMRDGAAWQVDNAQNTDIMDLKQKGTLYPPGVQGAYLAKSPGYTAITLSDPATGKHVRFRFYIVDKAAANEKAYRMVAPLVVARHADPRLVLSELKLAGTPSSPMFTRGVLRLTGAAWRRD